uniref:Response regulator receiver modulated metal dependent phosphohydrolase n=1 Tax=Geobacter sp. (strain M21) TaxID=443144 RepID=C6DZA7_GEOSM
MGKGEAMAIEKVGTTSKVLLVDDEENILRAIGRLLLEEDDLEVLTATSGTEGLEVLKQHPDVAVILSDQRMPGMLGADFLHQARGIAPDAVRMVLTGYADMAATMDAINKGGASRYITKPWDERMLRLAIMEGVEQYRLLQENRRLTALVERQNEELSEWNCNLKSRVLEQTATIRQQNQTLKERSEQIDKAFRNTIVAFSRLIEQHSTRLQKHTTNVTELSMRVAKELHLPQGEVETLRNAALLHDIGAIGLPGAILAKPTDLLTSQELEIFMQHAVRGQTALDEVEELREAGVIVRHHHENYDGTGFPDRLAGERIPLGSRIIAFADFIDRELAEDQDESAIASMLERVKKELGHRLDPALFPIIKPHLSEVYPASQRMPALVEKELRPQQLLEGMLVTRNLYTGSGLLLLSKGTRLDEYQIANIARHYKIDPPAGGVFIDWKAEGIEGPLHLKAVRNLKNDMGRQPVAELELWPGDLVEGMHITRDLYSGTGLLLLAVGSTLDAGKIVSLARYYNIDPPTGGVFVKDDPQFRDGP